MSVLFFRRPTGVKKVRAFLHPVECREYTEQGKTSKHLPPLGLSFERVLRDETLSPAKFDDWLDYMVYIGRDAEILQFYAWYYDYLERFDALSENEKALSPEWVFIPPTPDDNPYLRNEPSSSQLTRQGSTIQPRNSELPQAPQPVAARLGPGTVQLSRYNPTPPIDPQTSSFTLPQPRDPVRDLFYPSTGQQWQIFHAQPFRTEMERVVNYYIAPFATRRLSMSDGILGEVADALRHTTHPSVFAPMVDVVEPYLRHCAHPNFVRWIVSNGNKERMSMLRIIGIINLSLGLIMAISLTLSKQSRWWRIFAAFTWLFGSTILIAASNDVCVFLHYGHWRSLRPWEKPPPRIAPYRGADTRVFSRTLGFIDVPMQPLRRPYDPFGLPNDSFSNLWARDWQQKPVLEKIFTETVLVNDRIVRAIQDSLVRQAQLWAIIITIVLTIVFLALPAGNFF